MYRKQQQQDKTHSSKED